MAKKKSKLATPDWILEGFDSRADYEKAHGISSEEKKEHHGRTPRAGNALQGAKTFNIKLCPKCGSDDVQVVIGDVGKWECKKCGWKGEDIEEEEVNEEEFMKYLDKKGEEVA